MKIVKTYNQIVNESELDRGHVHLLTDEQVEWCLNHVFYNKWKVNSDGEVYTDKSEITICNAPDHFKVKFADCDRFSNRMNSKLKSLNGSPNKVNIDFDISHCTSLTSLNGGPRYVGSRYEATNTGILNLEGLAEQVGQLVDVAFSKITSVEGCSNNITILTLEGCDRLVNLKGISNNLDFLNLSLCRSLTSLEGLNKDFSGDIEIYKCGLPKEELIYNWQNDITQDEVDQFKQDWEI
jgi:hypothetical protein